MKLALLPETADALGCARAGELAVTAHGNDPMCRLIATLLGATAFQLTTGMAETRSAEIGDVIRLLLFGCAFWLFVAALPGKHANTRRRSGYKLDERFAGFGRRTVTLSLRAPREPRRTHTVAAE